MNRRTFLKGSVGGSVGGPILVHQSGIASAQSTLVKDVATSMFSAMPDDESEGSNIVVGCANGICEPTQAISQEQLKAAIDGGTAADEALQHAKFCAEILNERGLTTVIDVSTIESARQTAGRATHYLPVLGAGYNLRRAACRVETPNPDPEDVRDFMFSSLAFGMEIGLWTIGAPYQAAWKVTRFTSNRTFLRFANHGCNGCIALAMSELHWAIRGTIYGHVVEEEEIEFVVNRINELRLEAEDYAFDVDLDINRAEIEETLAAHGEEAVEEGQGILDGIMDWAPEIKL